MNDAGWAALDRALLAAHARGDRDALIGLYAQASDMAHAAGETDRAAFFATHAWVFALEARDPRAGELRGRLAGWGRVDGEGT